METDEMELDTIGDRKTALFVIISDTDDTFNFVVSILYTQLFNLLCDKADDEYGGRLPVSPGFSRVQEKPPYSAAGDALGRFVPKFIQKRPGRPNRHS